MSRPSLRNLPSISVQDAIAGGTLMVSLANEIGSAIGFPPLAGLTGLLLVIFDAINNVQTNQEQCRLLGERAGRIIVRLKSRLNDAYQTFQSLHHDAQWDWNWSGIPSALKENVERFEDTLNYILEFVRKSKKKSWASKLFQQNSIKDDIAALNTRLDDASEAFKMAALFDIQVSSAVNTSHAIEIKRKVDRIESQLSVISTSSGPSMDAHGFRLLHISDVDVRAELDIDTGWWANMAEVRTSDGQQKLMKRYYGRKARERMLRDIEVLRDMSHSNLPQLFGTSFENSSTPFIVLTNAPCRDIPSLIGSHFRKADISIIALLSLEISHDITSVVSFLTTAKALRSSEIGQLLRPDNIVLDDNGRIILGAGVDDAEDAPRLRSSEDPDAEEKAAKNLKPQCQDVSDQLLGTTDINYDPTSDTTSARRVRMAEHIVFHVVYGRNPTANISTPYISPNAPKHPLSERAKQAQLIPKSMRLGGLYRDSTPSVTFEELRDHFWSLGVNTPYRCYPPTQWGVAGDIGYHLPGLRGNEFMVLKNVADNFGELKIVNNETDFHGEYGQMMFEQLPGGILRYTFKDAQRVKFYLSARATSLGVGKDYTKVWRYLYQNAPQLAVEHKVAPQKLIIVTGIHERPNRGSFARLPTSPTSSPSSDKKLYISPPDVHLFVSQYGQFKSYWSFDIHPSAEPASDLMAADISTYVEEYPLLLRYIQLEKEDFSDLLPTVISQT